MKAAEQSSFDTRLQFLRALGEFSVEDERIWRLAVDTMEQIPRGKYSGPASAASVLMELDPHRAETLLRERFQIADQTLQGELLVVLSRGKNPDTLHFVMQELGSQPDEIRKQCIQGFGQAKTIEALPMLIDVVLDETASREVRMAAIRALEDIGSRDAVSALLGLVDHDDTFLVAMAIQSLGKLKDERAIPTLIRKLDDSRHAYYFGYYVHTWAEMTLHKFEQTSEITSAITAAFRKRNNLDGDK